MTGVLPYTYPLVAYEGDDFTFVFFWSVGDDAASATPVDLTGWSGKGQVRPGKIGEGETDELLIEFEVTTGGQDGRITAYADWEAMSGITEQVKRRRARYDIELTDPSGRKRTILRGPFIVDPETTKHE